VYKDIHSASESAIGI